ncbi:LexA family protein [Halopseudomonas salegens]|uniref:SOS response UmuD protein. Serine peptidase. MEROPS family S24 n=1 Tax=Halopseudomonas salegens TaxID=1434072 RepID=A0A1H2E919_9GAMM|nr:translesion error-prone DNA polymerase V autoproteolytic subunit [Halopseudomonas salegens]SDT91590.1 SOS response UmuD protein. Serine peptidase. MEROPS family S24 [Halopseudomonas salegens]
MSATLLGPTPASRLRLPLFSHGVAAGFPSPADDHRDAALSLDQLVNAQAAHTFLLRAQGDSMQGTGIYDGDILVVDRAVRALPGDVIIACIDNEFTVKTLTYEAGLPVLMPANPRFPPLRLQQAGALEVWGVVTHSLHKHRFR